MRRQDLAKKKKIQRQIKRQRQRYRSTRTPTKTQTKTVEKGKTKKQTVVAVDDWEFPRDGVVISPWKVRCDIFRKIKKGWRENILQMKINLNKNKNKKEN